MKYADEAVAEAHTALNLLQVVIDMMEGCYRGGEKRNFSVKMVKLCKAEQQIQLTLYDKARASIRDNSSTASDMAQEYRSWIDYFHSGEGDYEDFLKSIK